MKKIYTIIFMLMLTPAYAQVGDVLFNCVPCEIGTFSSGLEYGCTDCAAGTYQKEEGQSSCIDCELGSYQPNEKQASCLSCGKGNYCPNKKMVEVFKCPEGTYQDGTEATTCKTCPKGYYCPNSGETNGKAHLCGAGHYCPAGSATSDGKVKTYTKSSQNKYVLTNTSGAHNCEAGYYCLAGSYSSTGKTVSDETNHLCAIDYWCPTGSKNSHGLTDKEHVCADDPLGKQWLSGFIRNDCDPSKETCAEAKCGDNVYTKTVSYCKSTGSKKPNDNPYSSQTTPGPVQCGAGKYCEALANKGAQCTNCPAGTAKSGPGNAKSLCTACPIFTYQPNTGASSCSSCSYAINTGMTKCPTANDLNWTAETILSSSGTKTLSPGWYSVDMRGGPGGNGSESCCSCWYTSNWWPSSNGYSPQNGWRGCEYKDKRYKVTSSSTLSCTVGGVGGNGHSGGAGEVGGTTSCSGAISASASGGSGGTGYSCSASDKGWFKCGISVNNNSNWAGCSSYHDRSSGYVTVYKAALK